MFTFVNKRSLIITVSQTHTRFHMLPSNRNVTVRQELMCKSVTFKFFIPSLQGATFSIPLQLQPVCLYFQFRL